METLARLAHGFLNRVSFTSHLPESEQISNKPRPVIGFYAGLTADQKAKALAYRGPENIGEAGHRLDIQA